MNKININGVVYESTSSMSIINGKVICDGDVFINGKSINNEPDNLGQMIEKKYEISNIKDFVNNLTGFELIIDPNIEKEELIVVAPEKNQDKIDISFKNSKLTISSRSIYNNVKIIIKAKKLESLEHKGNGDVNLNINTEVLKIDNSGVGDIKGSISCHTLSIDKNGTSDVNLNIISEYVNIISSGTGDIKLNGKTNKLYVENEGVGDLKLQDFYGENISFKHSGVGNLKLWANTITNGKSNGVGNVKYYAKEDSNIKKTGLGSVKYLGSKEPNFKDLPKEFIKSEDKKVKNEFNENKSPKTSTTILNNDIIKDLVAKDGSKELKNSSSEEPKTKNSFLKRFF